MVKSSSSSRITAPLVREEWDFTACPKDKLYFCFAYEFARELARVVPAFRARFKNAPASEFDENGNWHYFLRGEDNDDDGTVSFAEMIDVPPRLPSRKKGFPAEAYLALDHRPTQNSYRPFGVGWPWVVKQWPIREVHFDGHSFHSGDLEEQLNLNPYDFYSMDIDWNCSPKKLTKAFQQWMKARRPQPPREQRGKSAVRYYRRVLKELGAYRLMEACGSLTAAWDYTIDLGVNQGRGLFTQEYEWYDARSKTRKILAEWQTAFDYLEKESFST